MKKSHKTILLIDDDRAIHNAFELALEDKPYKIISALSGVAGVEQIQKNSSIDLVFLDLKMPEISGVETLRLLRKFNTDVSVKIITAFAEEFMLELEKASKENLDFEIVRKPLERDQILEIVDIVLNVDAISEPFDRDAKYQLRLYVAGETPKSARTIESVRKVCKEYLSGEYVLEVIDIFKHPDQAERDQVLATPTLLKVIPEPVRRILGDLSNWENVLLGLDIKPLKNAGKNTS